MAGKYAGLMHRPSPWFNLPVLIAFGEQTNIQVVPATCMATYPCSCATTDNLSSPAHIYTYTFLPNANWTSYYAVCLLSRLISPC